MKHKKTGGSACQNNCKQGTEGVFGNVPENYLSSADKGVPVNSVSESIQSNMKPIQEVRFEDFVKFLADAKNMHVKKLLMEEVVRSFLLTHKDKNRSIDENSLDNTNNMRVKKFLQKMTKELLDIEMYIIYKEKFKTLFEIMAIGAFPAK